MATMKEMFGAATAKRDLAVEALREQLMELVIDVIYDHRRADSLPRVEKFRFMAMVSDAALIRDPWQAVRQLRGLPSEDPLAAAADSAAALFEDFSKGFVRTGRAITGRRG